MSKKMIAIGFSIVAAVIVVSWSVSGEKPEKCLSSESFLGCNMEITK
jgi:hypothetical protein